MNKRSLEISKVDMPSSLELDCASNVSFLPFFLFWMVVSPTKKSYLSRKPISCKPSPPPPCQGRKSPTVPKKNTGTVGLVVKLGHFSCSKHQEAPLNASETAGACLKLCHLQCIRCQFAVELLARLQSHKQYFNSKTWDFISGVQSFLQRKYLHRGFWFWIAHQSAGLEVRLGSQKTRQVYQSPALIIDTRVGGG